MNDYDERITDLENMSIEHRLIKVELALKDLRIYAEPLQQQIWQKNIIIRLEKLESNEYIYPKKPHKCPVCDGFGNRTKPNFQDGGELNFKCNSCEGRGIIWG